MLCWLCRRLWFTRQSSTDSSQLGPGLDFRLSAFARSSITVNRIEHDIRPAEQSTNPLPRDSLSAIRLRVFHETPEESESTHGSAR